MKISSKSCDNRSRSRAAQSSEAVEGPAVYPRQTKRVDGKPNLEQFLDIMD